MIDTLCSKNIFVRVILLFFTKCDSLTCSLEYDIELSGTFVVLYVLNLTKGLA